MKNTVKRQVYLDLDGVMADFDWHFPKRFGFNQHDVSDEEMWKHIDSSPNFFLEMPMCGGAKEFWNDIEHLDPIILTACPKSNYIEAAKQKKAWCRNNLSSTVTVLPVLGGTKKFLFMNNPNDILIDDFPKNIDMWVKHDGAGILHTNFALTRSRLKELLIIT